MRRWTNRQYQRVRIWLEERYNSPNLVEHYLMLVATEIRRSYVKHPGRVKLADLQLDFSTQPPADEEEWTEEEAKQFSDWQKQALLARWKLKTGPN